MIKSKLSHVCFSTHKLDSTFEFYTNVLSYEVIHKFFNEEGKVYGLIFNIGDGNFLEFFETSEPINSGNLFRHFCIAVSDIFQLQDQLKLHGISIHNSVLILSIMGIASALGRIIIGFAADLWGKLLMLKICMLVGGISTLCWIGKLYWI